MANKPDKDFGKRKPVSVPAAPRPGPPAKRSGHVALLLMGTFAVGTAAYTLMPNRNCEPSPNAATSPPQQNSTECASRSSSSSSHSSSGGDSGGSSSRSSYYSSDSSSSHSSSGTSDSGSHSVQRGGFGSFAHAFGFSGG